MTPATVDRALIVGGALAVLVGVLLLLGGGPDPDGSGDAAAGPAPPTTASDGAGEDDADEAAATDDADGDAAEDVDDPPAASPSPSPEATTSEPETDTAEPETPEAFFAAWQRQLNAEDVEFALSRLHPVILGAYGEEQCRAYIASVTDPELRVTVLGTEPLDGFRYTLDGLDLAVEEPTVRVTLERADLGGDPYEAAATLALRDDGTRAWFTDCGDPL